MNEKLCLRIRSILRICSSSVWKLASWEAVREGGASGNVGEMIAGWGVVAMAGWEWGGEGETPGGRPAFPEGSGKSDGNSWIRCTRRHSSPGIEIIKIRKQHIFLVDQVQ